VTRTAITGASGYLGRAVAAHLQEHGHDLLLLGRVGETGQLARLDPDTLHALPDSAMPLDEHLQAVDNVIHLAARLQERQGMQVADFLADNVALTERVARAAISAGVRRMVFASSRLVYASVSGAPCRESQPGLPDTPYGISKRFAEDVLEYCARDTGMTVISLRIGQVLGMGQRGTPVAVRFIEQARAGEPVAMHGQGRAVRDFVYIRDVVRAFACALDPDVPEGAYNIGGGQGLSIAEMAATVAGVILGDRSRVCHLPTAQDDNSSYRMDCSKAAELLGWQPKWTFEQAVIDIAQHLKAEPARGFVQTRKA